MEKERKRLGGERQEHCRRLKTGIWKKRTGGIFVTLFFKRGGELKAGRGGVP